MFLKHGPIVKNLGDDDVVRVDCEKRGPLLINVGDVNVIHVDLQEPWSGREKSWRRRRNTRGLLETWFGREKPRRRRRKTRGFKKNMFSLRETLGSMT